MGIALIPTWLQEYETEQNYMVEILFRCNECKGKKLYNGIEVAKHKKETGHNSFRMIRK